MPGQRAKDKITKYESMKYDSNQLIEWFRINKMQAYPDKFQLLAVGRKTYDKNPSIHIQNFNLTLKFDTRNSRLYTLQI
jgi:hypothetical protein